MNVLITIIKYTLVYFLGHITGKYIVMLFLVKKHAKEKHICNSCRVGFLSDVNKLQYVFCPYCGEPLDYHEEDERSRTYQAQRRYGDDEDES